MLGTHIMVPSILSSPENLFAPAERGCRKSQSLRGDAQLRIDLQPSRFLMQTNRSILLNTFTVLQPQTIFQSCRQCVSSE